MIKTAPAATPQVVKRNQVEHTKTERQVLEAVQHPYIVNLYYAY